MGRHRLKEKFYYYIAFSEGPIDNVIYDTYQEAANARADLKLHQRLDTFIKMGSYKNDGES